MEIEVRIKRSYGNELFYPVNDDAKLLCELIGTTTITKDKLKKIREHGWDVKIKQEEYQLD